MNLEFLINNPHVVAQMINQACRLTSKIDGNAIKRISWCALYGATHQDTTYYHQVPSAAFLAEGQNSSKPPMFLGRLYGNMQLDNGAAADALLNVYSRNADGSNTKIMLEIDPERFDNTSGLGSLPIDYDCMLFEYAQISHDTNSSNQSHLNFMGLKIDFK